MGRRALADYHAAWPAVARVRGTGDVVTGNRREPPVAQIDRIKQRVRRLGKAEESPNAWYYRMPWVLAAAAVMVVLI
jgi:hypothetical protein